MKSLKKATLALGSLSLAITLVVAISKIAQDSPKIAITPESEMSNSPSAVAAGGSTSASVVSTRVPPSSNVPVKSPQNKNNTAIANESELLASRMDQMQTRRLGTHFNADEVKAAMAQPSAWQTDPSVADTLNLDEGERYDGREFIRFSPIKLESLVPGDVMEIPLAQQNATYQMVVDSVQVHDDGNVTWYGHLKDFPEENQVSFTRGQDLTVGSIAVPDKQFTLQAQNELGWVVNSFTLFKGGDEHLFPDGAEQDADQHDAHEHGAHQHSHTHDHES